MAGTITFFLFSLCALVLNMMPCKLVFFLKKILIYSHSNVHKGSKSSTQIVLMMDEAQMYSVFRLLPPSELSSRSSSMNQHQHVCRRLRLLFRESLRREQGPSREPSPEVGQFYVSTNSSGWIQFSSV